MQNVLICMTKNLDFYYDFISPYSYIAHKKISELKKKTNIKFNYKGVLLGGLHKIGGITAPFFINTKAKFMIRDCKMVTKKLNLKFTFNSNFPINSLKLMRGTLVIDDKIKEIYIDKIFDAYWGDGLNLSDEIIFNKILAELNINKTLFYKNIRELKIKEKLKRNTNDAHDKGVFGAPTYIVNKKIFWGQDRLEYALDEYNK